MIPDRLTVLLHLISKMGRDEVMLLHVKPRSTNGVCSEAPSLDPANTSHQRIKRAFTSAWKDTVQYSKHFLVYWVNDNRQSTYKVLNPLE